jgi:tetratricopeptide (TPR) repeat protein
MAPPPDWLQLGSIQSLRQLAAVDPRAQRDLGLLLILEAHHPGEGEAALRQVVERVPHDPLAWLALGVATSELGLPAQALSSFGQALRAALVAGEYPDWCGSPAVTRQPTPDDCHRLALIVEEIAARQIREHDYAGRRQLVTELLPLVGQLSYPAAYQLHRVLEQEARVAGEPEAALEQLLLSGALRSWRAVGPFGAFPYRGFDESYPPERDSQFQPAYDLGHGRGRQTCWTPLLSGSTVQLRAPNGRRGTWYVETVVQADRSGPVDVRLWVPRDVVVAVSLGGEEVLRLDPRESFGPAVAVGRVELPANQPVRVLVKLASNSNDPGFSLALRDAAGHPLTQLAPAEVEGRGQGRGASQSDMVARLAPRPGQPINGLHALIAALFAGARSDGSLADEVLHRVQRPSPLLLSFRARASAGSPSLPRAVRDDQMLGGMRQAFSQAPELWRARLVVARKMAADEQFAEALTLLQQGVELVPENRDLWHELGVQARRVGQISRAREAFGQALSLDGTSCGSLFQLAMIYHDLSWVGQRDEALERVVRCDATSEARAQVWAEVGRPVEALAELRRVQQVAEYPAGLEDDIADLALAANEPAAARQVLERLASRWPRADAYVGSLADLDGAAQGPPAAARRLAAALEQFPWEMGRLRRVSGLLGNAREVEAWRIDGAEHIRMFQAQEVRYDAPCVYIVDRAVYRVFPDGSSLELVHQVTKVLTQEAVGQLSEFSPPRGAEVLTLRTIKADGTVLEPHQFDEEETTNLANVEVGDFVEWEYLISRGPSRTYPGGFNTPRFYFVTAEAAMHLSELVVLVPEDMEIDFVPRGPNPPSPQPIELGGLRGVRYAVSSRPSMVTEPHMPSPNEVYPSVAALRGEDVELAVAGWSDDLSLDLRPDWRMKNLVRDLREPGQNQVQLARLLYDYVLDHVRPGRHATAASVSLAAGQGDVLRLFVALLQHAGFEPAIVYSWSVAADRSGPYLLPRELGHPLVRVELDGEAWWVSMNSRYAPFGHVPAAVRGQPGIVAGAEPEEITLPRESAVPDRSELNIQGRIEATGVLAFAVDEVFHGARATEFRQEAARIPEADRQQRAANFLGHQFPGSVGGDFNFSGIEERHEPLRLTARLRSRMLGRREGPLLLLPARLAQSLRYADLTQLSERRMPLIFNEELHEVIEQRLQLPAGSSVQQLCPSQRRRLGDARFSVDCRVHDDVLIHRLEVYLPVQRVAPEDYREFASFLRLVDDAGRRETRVRMP